MAEENNTSEQTTTTSNGEEENVNTSDLGEMVAKWQEVKDQLKQIRAQNAERIAPFKEREKEFKETILSEMEKESIKKLNVGGKVISITTKATPEKPKQEDIIETLSNATGSEKKARKLFEKIYHENRPIKVSKSLRVKEGVTASGDASVFDEPESNESPRQQATSKKRKRQQE